MGELLLAEELREHLRAAVQAGYPRETCGLLIGRQDGGGTTVREVIRARNLCTARASDRYELDPKDFLAADREARAAGLEIVGIWHSHPDHPARPSETDRAGAWQGWSYLIASVTRDGVGELRSWRLRGDDFEEEHIRP
jgi:proteasome lid subunit RPN8/RPN11